MSDLYPNELDRLSRLLNAVQLPNHAALDASAGLAALNKAMERRLANIDTSGEPEDLQRKALLRFCNDPRFPSLKEARLVAFGLSLPVPQLQHCMLEDKELFYAALDGIERGWGKDARLFRRCYQGLLRSYFSFDIHGRQVTETGKANWARLQDYLRDRTSKLRTPGFNPDWVACVERNCLVFGPNPCAGFAEETLCGETERLNDTRKHLGISEDSWFMRELVLEQVRYVSSPSLPDVQFNELFPPLLRLLDPLKSYRNEGLAAVIERYALIPRAPVHPELRDKTQAWWGYPPDDLNENPVWESLSHGARTMMKEWLTRELIELFFLKMQKDGRGDRRRFEFWSQYVKAINGIRFALGSGIMRAYEPSLLLLRKKLSGLYVELENATRDNNAFIMTMGDVQIVEFSDPSNASYFYRQNTCQKPPFDLSRTVYASPVDGVNSLKQSSHALKLAHKDNYAYYANWEEKFQDELKCVFGITQDKPSSRYIPSPAAKVSTSASHGGVSKEQSTGPDKTGSQAGQPNIKLKANPGNTDQAVSSGPVSTGPLAFSVPALENLARRTGGGIDDKRSIGGYLTVYNARLSKAEEQQLIAWGFQYYPGRGWRKE